MSPCLGPDAGHTREAKQRKLNYSTKVFEGVPMLVKGELKVTNDGSNYSRMDLPSSPPR